MASYNELYFSDIAESQAAVFEMIRDYLPGVDEKWFINAYMKSQLRAALDSGHAIYANMLPGELIDDFLKELKEGYKHGDKWGGFLPYWVGSMYARIQWKYDIKSNDLIDAVTLEDMQRYFIPFHQIDEELAADKIWQDIKINDNRRE